MPALLKRAVPFGLLMAGFALYYRVDMVMLEWLAGPGELGRYAAAYRFLDTIIALAASLGGPLFPRLAPSASGAHLASGGVAPPSPGLTAMCATMTS